MYIYIFLAACTVMILPNDVAIPQGLQPGKSLREDKGGHGSVGMWVSFKWGYPIAGWLMENPNMKWKITRGTPHDLGNLHMYKDYKSNAMRHGHFVGIVVPLCGPVVNPLCC